MSSPESPARRPRASLTRESIVDAAVAVLDERGLSELTMRAVAARLDAGAMSLYRHVSGREELLDLVVARLTAEVPARPATGAWRADLAALARDVRAALLRRPNLTVLLTSRAGLGGGLATLEHALGILRGAGFGPHDAALANHALGNYVAGAALWEAVGLEGATGEERRARAGAAADGLARLPAGAWPSVAWASQALFAGGADDRFEFGLAVLLDGLEARLAASRR
jgi:TetR/AcrR family transcriptional regulator, tetracycline repressor protein